MPVSPIASSTGKKSINTGVRIVPSPNPEKKVRMAAKKAVTEIIPISIKVLVDLGIDAKVTDYVFDHRSVSLSASVSGLPFIHNLKWIVR